ncbi:hypothetical protein DJ017_17445 [Phenylobacterium soli]|uniref:Uncharacterized protein n=1 Tax=Phenylobacterium soli TaxID=2170551 RepID=A0A328AAI0_9CAUL|nr:hypothetical protein DJ017_17445 [Phenylobacterium soli]
MADRLDVATDRAQAAEARVEKLREALEELLSACEADFGVPDDGDEDDEAVDGGEGGDMAVTFGMLRRARAALSTTEEKP